MTNPSEYVPRCLKAGLVSLLLSLPADGNAQGTNLVPLNPSSPQTGNGGNPQVAATAISKEVPGQLEIIQRLLNQVGQLEKAGVEQAERIRALQETYQESEKKFQEQVKELQGKLLALEGGRVLPEIALPAKEAPSLQELDQKIRIVERKNEIAAETAEVNAREAPKISIGSGGFSFGSADTNFTLKIRGVVQLDSRTFFHDNPLLQGNDGFVLRRARPIIEGTVYRDFNYQFIPDFGGSSVQIFDANLGYRISPEFQLKAGKFKGPVGLEQLQADSTLAFNERSLATDLVPTRNVGVQLGGEVVDGTISYAGGIFNGAGDSRNPNTSDFGDNKEYAGRLFIKPFKQLHLQALEGFGFGLGGSYSQVRSNVLGLPNTTGGTLPGYTTDGQQQFFAYNPVAGTVVADGTHWRLAPQATYLAGPFGILGEYTVSHQGVLNNATLRRAQLEHTAWQASAQWVLTGEAASFTGVNPTRPFDLHSGQWGAWQLVGRFGQLTLDDATFPNFSNPGNSARSATAWSVGVNWWLNKNVRLLTSFSHTTFEGGGTFRAGDVSTRLPPATVTYQDENVLFTRMQVAF